MEGNRPTEGTVGPSGAPVELRLFVAGRAAASARARVAVERLRPDVERIGGRIEVIDVLERPDLAEEERIVATPVLVRSQPPPRRSIVGDVSDWQVVAEVLDLESEGQSGRSSKRTEGA